MELELAISKESYNETALKLLNVLINHRDCELKILIAMLNNDITVINTESRKRIASLLDIDVTSLNHCIWILKSKGSLVKVKEGYLINTKILKAVQEKTLSFIFHVN